MPHAKTRSLQTHSHIAVEARSCIALRAAMLKAGDGIHQDKAVDGIHSMQ